MRRIAMLAAGALLAVPAAAAKPPAPTDEEPSGRIYTTREERREAGLEHALTGWLLLALLAELEYGEDRFRALGEEGERLRTRSDDFSRTFQLGLELQPLEWLKAELIYEYEADDEGDRHLIDEAILAFERGAFEAEIGRIVLPFGVYFSHFASGPLPEFGETRGRGAVLSWKPVEGTEFAAFAYDGRAEKLDGETADDDHGVDWGAAAQVSPFEFLSFGASYLSDLADSEERLLDDTAHRYARRVDAASVYAVAGLGDFELSAEYLTALRSFAELEPDRDRPSAWNLELAWFPLDRLEGALRYEESRELEDAPERQYGLALAWRIARGASLTVEYLRGEFAPGLAEDAAERELEDVHRVGAQLVVSF